MTFEPAFRMAERELLSSLIDSENEFDAVQRRLLELSELFPLTFWKHFSDEISDFVFIVHDFSIVWTQEKRN